MQPDEFEKIKDRALRLLARRDHSAFELKAKLKQKLKIQNEDFEELLTYLKKLGYMASENGMAERWIKEWRKAGRGRHWIAGKLKTKGLPCPDLSDNEDEKRAAQYFLGKKLAGRDLKALDFEERGRLARALVSRGFSHSLVATLIR